MRHRTSQLIKMMSMPHQVSTAHLLGAAALAGVLGLALWVRGRRATTGPSRVADTLKESGNVTDEIILFGEKSL